MFRQLNYLKDKIASPLIMLALQKLIIDFGKIADFQIDSRKRTIVVSLLLYGEPRPIGITITDYRIENSDSHMFFIIRKISSTRAWVTALANKYPEKLRIELPEQFRKIVSLLLS
jgi:hypothetical protein